MFLGATVVENEAKKGRGRWQPSLVLDEQRDLLIVVGFVFCIIFLQAPIAAQGMLAVLEKERGKHEDENADVEENRGDL